MPSGIREKSPGRYGNEPCRLFLRKTGADNRAHGLRRGRAYPGHSELQGSLRAIIKKDGLGKRRWRRLTMLLKEIACKIINRIFIIHNGVVNFYNNDAERRRRFNLAKKIKNESEVLLSYDEAYQVFMATKAVAKIEGDMAEVGVYKGGSAKLICEAKGDKPLHLFDTFEGLPEICKMDDPKVVKKGDYPASLEEVKEHLKQYPGVYFYKGLFPATAKPVENKRFSFVNLDVDLYESTLAGLNFFYPRMNAGGVIMSHDYIFVPGVKRAFDDFFKDKPEPIIELSGSQCLVVKTSENYGKGK
jgi:hypothetical protein